VTHFGLVDQELPAGQTGIAEKTRLLCATYPPVFLHCGWRTRGTWIWNRFRGLRGVTGYYEPLGEQLAQVRTDTLAAINAESWPSGHRGLDRPYFDEFRPLLRTDGMGVRGYQTRFATGDFFAAPDSALPELQLYLRELLNASAERGEQPVLKLCRSIGRIGWMRQHFPDALHIVVMRDPFTQFASALRQFVRNGNAYFLAMPMLLLAMNRDLPAVSHCVRQLGAELPDSSRVGLALCEATLRSSDPDSWYRGFLAFWIATAATLPDAVDLVIDSDALAQSGSYRSCCELELARLTGQTLDFDDADCRGGTGEADSPVLQSSRVLHIHGAAEATLVAQLGPTWADAPGLGLVSRKLAQARSCALGYEVTAPTSHLAGRAHPEKDPEFAAMQASAMVRAAWAERELAAVERELAAVLASHSWKVTAPLRWLRRHLG
jgi:hypothetical protein